MEKDNQSWLNKQLESLDEYEREPVPENKLKGWRGFLGMYAGEHTAGTEFVIGALFVAHGVSFQDLVIGLIIGNLLAVLSWAFLCAPVAVKAKLTLFTIWHVIFFAWFANMAMHIGMSDMSILRYAKKWQYGFSSAAGMFFGHFLAWMASGVLMAAAAGAVAPGLIAYNSAGIAGAVCVVIAGWTTANPTIYRAGLAFQSVTPNWKRWKVTLFTGIFTTIIACFTALVMNLLDFVALYGLVLMPMGAVVFLDVLYFKKMKLIPNFAEERNIKINWAAGITWFFTLGFCLFLYIYVGIEIFFLGLPGWFVAVIIYIAMSMYFQKNSTILIRN